MRFKSEIILKMENEGADDRRLSVAVAALVGGFLVQMTLGGIYIRSNMNPYMLLYMKNYTNNSIKSTETFWLWIFDLTVFGFGSSVALGGYIEAKMGPFFTLILGSWVMSFSIIACYWTIQVNVIALAATHGLLAAIGAGIAYSVSMAAPIEWFPKSKGLVCGILDSGFAFVPFHLDMLQAYFINPALEQVRIKDPYKVPVSFLIIGASCLPVQLLGAILTKRRRPIVEEISDNDIIPLFELENRQTHFKPHQLIYQCDFWILWMSYCLNSSVTIIIMKLCQKFGGCLGFSRFKLVIVAEFASISNAIGKIVCGYLTDKIPYKVLMSILTLATALMIGTFYCCSLVGDTTKIDEINRYTFYFIWTIVLYFLLSGSYSVFPAMCVKTFGVKHFAGNYGVLFTAFSFSALVTSLATFKLLNENIGLNIFLATFLTGCGLSILSCVVTQFYTGRLNRNLSVR